MLLSNEKAIIALGLQTFRGTLQVAQSWLYRLYNFLTPEWAIKEDLVINKQDLANNKFVHPNEPFQVKNRRDKI